MKCAISFLLLFAALPAPSLGDGPHPIEKVIGLLQGLIAKVEAEARAETLSYEKFQYWCKNSEKTLNAAIAGEKEQIDSLESKIEGKTKEAASLEEQIAALEEQIAQQQGAQKKADDDRREAAALYEDTSADLKATIAAVDEAIKVLQEAKGEVTAALLQRNSVRKALELAQTLAGDEQRAELVTLLRQGAAAGPAAAPVSRPDLEARGDYKGHIQKYKFKSGNVIELLKQLKAKFEGDELDTNKAETNAQNGHALAGDALKNAMDAAKASKETKTNTLADVKSELDEAKANLKDQRQLLEDDSATLEETQKSCNMKATEWAERSDMRAKELEAMHMAIKILAKVGGVRTEPPSNPVPPPSPLEAEEEPVSLLQVADPKMKAVNLLRAKARVLHSKALERLAQEVAAHLTGPFDEVNNMIQKMIFRLMAEQKDEDDHKHWCDLELEKTNSSKINKEDKIADLTAKIDDAKATVEQLIQEIREAEDMIAAIIAHVNEATDIRKIGKEENAVALKDSQDAQTAIANAVSVLQTFYKNSGEVPKEPWEFLQRGVELPENPATWDSAYTGVADPNEQPGGIVSVLKEISSDFARMEADTRAQEETDQKEFEDEMKDCAIEKAKRTKESEMKSQEKKRLNDKIDEMSKRRKHVSDELEAVVQYLKDLRPACVEGDSTYEDRKAARSAEIGALKDAQGILEDAFKGEGKTGASAGAPSAAQLTGAVAPAAAFLSP